MSRLAVALLLEVKLTEGLFLITLVHLASVVRPTVQGSGTHSYIYV